MIAILDYGSGNLRSAQRAFERSGKEVVVTSDREVALNAQGLVVPGVGAFAACMRGLVEVGGDAIVRERLAKQRPTLGICVGMQVMFENGLEHGEKTAGLHQWPGDVTEIKASILPHMGWNNVQVANGSKMFKGVETEKFYFVHSFAAKDLDLHGTEKIDAPLKHFATHGEKFLAAVEDGALCATQFHPEKSGKAGLTLIANWSAAL